MKVIKVKKWDLIFVREHPDHLFIFGDNDIQRGKKGQAIIRDEPNAMGIPTKKLPSYAEKAYYSDYDLEQNMKNIDLAVELIVQELPKYEVLVLPTDGFGTGLADLPRRAPETFKYLVKKVKELINKAKYVRKVPPVNPSQLKLNTKLLGLDGNIYKNIKTTDGVHWRMVYKCADEKQDKLSKKLEPDPEKFTIYGTKTCPFCDKAKDLLDEYGEKYIYHDITKIKKEVFEILKCRLGQHRTVPIIFYAGQLVGGFNDLKLLLKQLEEDDE